MIDRIYFELLDGRHVWPWEDFRIILKSFDAPPPAPKLYRVSLEGRNGALDMTEWAGDIKYEDRAVKCELLDMNGKHESLVSMLTGRRCELWKSDDDRWMYEGRVDSIETETRHRVTNLTVNMTCKPFRKARALTTVTKTISTSADISLRAERMPVIPTLTLTAACSATWDGETYSLAAGTHTPAWLVLTDTAKTLTLAGSGTATLQWRDGVL